MRKSSTKPQGATSYKETAFGIIPRSKLLKLEIVTLLAWFQHRFVFIHPFQDYNGRIARMITILILLQLDLPPTELKIGRGTDRKKYLAAMQKADEGDYSFLEQLISQTLSEMLQS